MAAAVSKAAFPAVVLAISLIFSGVLGDLNREFTCEQLDRSTCAFAVSSSGLRCVLEKHVLSSRKEEYSCRNSGFKATGVAGMIETDECVAACGLDRDTFGISSDSLLDRRFMRRLCSPDCYDGCFNVFDLYSNVAASEGVSLTNMCGRDNNRREMKEEEAAAPNPGNRKLGVFLGNRGLISVHDDRNGVTAEEEAATHNPGNRKLGLFRGNRGLIFVQDNWNGVTAEEEAAAPNPGNRSLGMFPGNRGLISAQDDGNGVTEEEEAAAPNSGNRSLGGWR